MKNALFLIAIVSCMAILVRCTDSGSKPVEEAAAPAPTHQDTVKHGEYLVGSIGCDDCHSPKRMGANGPEVIPETRLSGYPGNRPFQKPPVDALKAGWSLTNQDFTAWMGAWGTSFAANLTPDDTGLGPWTLPQFMKAIREGKSKGLDGTRPLLPPMPWPSYRNLSDYDLASIFYYLKTIKPVQNVVPQPLPPDMPQ